MSKEVYMGRERYASQLAVTFKPFKGARSFYWPPKGKAPFYIHERYDYPLLLRRWISHEGIDGFVDVISENPTAFIDKLFIDKLAVMARHYRLFLDHPLGDVMHKVAYRGNDQYEPIEVPSILRFSFLLNNPHEYVKLLTTYGMVDLGKERFLLTFNLNQLAIKRRLQRLEEGQSIIVSEKNLFNMRKLEEIMGEMNLGDGVDYAALHKPEEDPGRIAFVSLPEDLKKLRTISVTFHKFDDWGEAEYPTQPIQPNLQPIPILA